LITIHFEKMWGLCCSWCDADCFARKHSLSSFYSLA
jgi:hypothetical protein